jgi:hypothetical protein
MLTNHKRVKRNHEEKFFIEKTKNEKTGNVYFKMSQIQNIYSKHADLFFKLFSKKMF